MGQITSVIQKATVFHKVGKVVALAASTGAALVTVVSALYSYGVIGKAESHNSIGNLGAAWVGLRPGVDTAFAIGDTTHYAATIADKNGSILVGARPTWTTGDSNVAVVRADGSVIARGPGTTTVSVVVGDRSSPTPRSSCASAWRASPWAACPRDSFVVVPEGNELKLNGLAYDSRGHLVNGRASNGRWTTAAWRRSTRAALLTANAAGHTYVTAKIDERWGARDLRDRHRVGALAVAGANQHALAGKTLAQPGGGARANRRGGPAPGQTVTFKLAEGQGVVEPRTAVTDADGRVRATWTLGDYPGRQTLLASVETVDSALAIVAESDPVAANTRVDGAGGTAHAAAPASSSPTRWPCA